MKLTLEQREDLADMQESWPSVLALCDTVVAALRARLTTTDISKSSRDLVLARARYDGAMDVRRALEDVKRTIKKEEQ